MGWPEMFRPGMRTYLIPLTAGLVLAVSAFMPWVVVDEATLAGFPDVLALWILGLGLLAAILSTLSMITRKNSRHPLLLIGLVALGITFLSWRIVPAAIEERALVRSQAVAIVERAPAPEVPETRTGSGIYAGLGASVILVGFGLTIVITRGSRPYVLADPNDDV